METKEIIAKIIEDENISNISLGENSFIIKFGDVKNTRTNGTISYTLFGTYVEIPYTFDYSKFKLHREIVNEFETLGVERDYRYSGFVHYDGDHFCYGECGVNKVAATIQLDGLNAERLGMLIVKFRTYLSTSSHGTRGYYKTIDFPQDSITTIEISNLINKDGIIYPSKLKNKVYSRAVESIDFNQPYTEVLMEVEDKAFVYNNEVIIPKVVRHPTASIENTKETEILIRFSDLNNFIKNRIIDNLKNEINYKSPITFQDCLHKLPDFPRRMDGRVYL